ncbi:inositol monophosphatase family protein [Streptomyces sp. Ag109_O5-1]|uniref:inositol monophosphatase family protein n=1 Tax=Streptomyces sp. Ag109_O5-1 TaxID=1938851 RepID=UPI000F4EE1D3|nr:inositol monophosphatase family protein [Streptomyces sp. Ag109_O5-1]
MSRTPSRRRALRNAPRRHVLRTSSHPPSRLKHHQSTDAPLDERDRGTPRKPSTGSGTCHGALLVATGQLDTFLLLGAGPWDIAPLIPIVQEAGGTFSDLAGQYRTDTGAALFARPGLHQQLLDIAVATR